MPKYSFTIDELRLIKRIKTLFEDYEYILRSSIPETFTIEKSNYKIFIGHNLSGGKLYFDLAINFEKSFESNGNTRICVRDFKSNPKIDWLKKLTSDPTGNYFYGWKGDIDSLLRSWISLLLEYSKFKFPEYFNPHESRYSDELFQEWRLTDERADIEPFPLKVQLALDTYLDDAIIIATREQEKTGEDYGDIITSAKELKKNQSHLSKNETLKRLTGIWAKARSKSIPFLKSLITETIKALFVELGKKMIGF